MLIGLIIAAVVVIAIIILIVVLNTQNTGTNTSGYAGAANGTTAPPAPAPAPTASGPTPTGTGAAKAEKEEVEASIMSIGIVDENNKIVASGTSKQYVNILKDAKYIDTGNNIKHTGILSRKLKFKVTFDQPGSHKFYVKLVPEATNVAYTTTEKNRHANFKDYADNITKYQAKGVEFTTDGNGEKIIDGNGELILSPAGGDAFTLVATDEKNNEVKSGKIQTERVMYYEEAKMTGLTTCANNLDIFKNEYIKHGINFQGLPAVSIPYMENIGANDGDTFKSNVQAAYNASNKNPYCVAIAYTGHLAVKDANKRISHPNVQGGNSTPVNIIIKERDISSGVDKQYALWNNIVAGEDWFVECFFIKNGGTVADKVTIAKSKCTPIQAAGYPPGYFDNVNIDVSGLPAETGTITLKVNWVNRMRGGLSFPGTNIVAICTKAWWQNESSNNQNDVIVHEVGHQLKMVANGSGNLPDKTSNHYTGKGHAGDHCSSGLSTAQKGAANYALLTPAPSSNCVMYGATNNHSDFCPNCAKAVKKLDLSNGI